MPLILAPLDAPLKVIDVNSDETTKKHLWELGFTKDAPITLLSREKNGGVVVRVHTARLALDVNVARAIQVEFA